MLTRSLRVLTILVTLAPWGASAAALLPFSNATHIDQLDPRDIEPGSPVDLIMQNNAFASVRDLLPQQYPKRNHPCRGIWEDYQNCVYAYGKDSCAGVLHKAQSCRISIGRAKEGTRWMAGYYTNGDVEITTQDTGAMHCIIDLHFRKKRDCISIADRPCSWESRGQKISVGKSEMGWGAGPISMQASRTFQAATDALLGVKKSYPDVYLWTMDSTWDCSSIIDFDRTEGDCAVND